MNLPLFSGEQQVLEQRSVTSRLSDIVPVSLKRADFMAKRAYQSDWDRALIADDVDWQDEDAREIAVIFRLRFRASVVDKEKTIG